MEPFETPGSATDSTTPSIPLNPDAAPFLKIKS